MANPIRITVADAEEDDDMNTNEARVEAFGSARVEAWREGAAMAYDPASALRLADYFASCGPHHFWVEGDPAFTPEREPCETKRERAARIKRSRERRLRAAVERIRAYEQDHPVNTHGVRTGPSTASNNWRHRAANVDRDVTDWLQYQNDVKAVQRLLGLLKSEGD